jgi:protein FAM50
MNRTTGPNKRLLFDYSSQPPPLSSSETSDSSDLSNYNPLSNPSSKPKTSTVRDIKELEGASDEPTFTKVVDRRWYERNKHIFPASVWQEFDPEKDYEKEVKRDAGGNAFFFS